MAKDTKFKPGQSGNPTGRPPLPEDLKAVRLLTATELRLRIMQMLELSDADLDAKCSDRGIKALDMMLAKICQAAIKGGDQQRLDFILNRLVGKVQDKVEVTMPKPFVVVRGSGEQVVMGVEKKDEE